MGKLLKIITCIFLMYLLTGCIAEEYDFTPPAVTLSTSDSIQSEELKEANVHWTGENSKLLERKTEDFLSFAREQKQLSFTAGQRIDLLFDSEDFVVEELAVSVWKNDEKIDLELDEQRSFYFPKEKGKYAIVVELETDRGSAQYVGNIAIN
ncbi:hypothetical protein M4D55_09555 [Metabacillus idriensis]|uniref:hypothetical protein n=1 Tax=Metabacillus idriensis TaxID=324768 RepID=UPI0008A9BA6A|nr:hypothetical protein [Metabacillus idriensis]MCM3596027.1 hypothetical protein [Metabacillus idriensis]OHR73822.1 hypothetical protein HMPREF3291_05425 [Bacillus sp. HMSC76G11]